MTSQDSNDIFDISSKIHLRTEPNTGMEFYWPEADDGAWDGPLRDWMESHRNIYFSWLKERRVCVTAGACCGMYATWYGNVFDWVYAFEPEPINFYCLVRNAVQPNVFKFNCALGAKPQTAAINVHHVSNSGCHTIEDSVPGAVPIIPLDSLGLNRIDLLQLDAEGYESKILMGGRETILRTKPIIVIERGPGYDAAHSFLIEELDYKERDTSASDVLYAPVGYEKPAEGRPLEIIEGVS
jgi:FkbM family methyltransferase